MRYRGGGIRVVTLIRLGRGGESSGSGAEACADAAIDILAMGSTVSSISLVVGMASRTHVSFFAVAVVVYVAFVAVCGVEVGETRRWGEKGRG